VGFFKALTFTLKLLKNMEVYLALNFGIALVGLALFAIGDGLFR